MEKNCVLNHSLNQSPSLFHAPGTEAFASELLLLFNFLYLSIYSINPHRNKKIRTYNSSS